MNTNTPISENAAGALYDAATAQYALHTLSGYAENTTSHRPANKSTLTTSLNGARRSCSIVTFPKCT